MTTISIQTFKYSQIFLIGFVLLSGMAFQMAPMGEMRSQLNPANGNFVSS